MLEISIKLILFLTVILLLSGYKGGHKNELYSHYNSSSWILDSFEDFIDGTFDDSGINAYVAADGSLRLINQWDLTEDGYVDILLPNIHGQNESPSFFIYYGKDNWSSETRMELPSDGGQAAAVADLNHDGRSDIVLINRFNGTKSELDLWIYWGNEEGFSPDKRTSLPTRGAEAVSVGDLNDNGYPDIVVANSGLSYHVSVDSFGKSFIYWNREGNFSSEDRTELPTIHARDVEVTDINKNGKLDIVFANEGNDDGEGGVRVFLNSGSEDFVTKEMIFLSGEKSSAVEAEDLNQDGWPDLVVANAFHLEGREGGIYNITESTYLNSYIYWGRENGFSSDHRTELPTLNPQDISIGDINHSGWPDIFFAQGEGGVNFLYYGGPDGFAPNKRQAISGSHDGASEIVDLNSDGWNDLIVFTSNSMDSSHNEVHTYWGGEEGLDINNPHVIPAGNTGGITVGDVNGDGNNDIIVVNRSIGPDANQSPAYLYPGDSDGFSLDHRIEIDAVGADSYLAADLDADSHVDLFMPQRPPIIYWGGVDGFDIDQTTTLSNQYAVSARTADFNRDGFLDLVASEWSPGRDKTHIYYGGPTGFSTAYRQEFPIRSVRYHTIADLDNNGWIDVLFPNFLDEEVVIFWNSPLGFDPDHRTVLPVRSAVSVEVADLNGDGFLDAIVPNLFDKNPDLSETQSFGGSPDAGTFIFWGGPDGPVPENPTVLPSVGAADAVVADLDNDGDLDLILTSYHAGKTRSHPSYIYWNSNGRFDSENVTMIPTHSASGALVADFNRDDWPDIFFANHSKDGNHRTDSWLYWGGADGFSEGRRTALPGIGPHMLTVMDIGHVFDRRDSYSYTSPVYSAGSHAQAQNLTWEAETPFETKVRFQIRAATTEDGLETASWVGPNGAESYFTHSGENVSSEIAGSWFQIRAEMISPNSANSPIIRQISLKYQR